MESRRAVLGPGGSIPLRLVVAGPMLARLALVLAALSFVAVLSAGLPVLLGLTPS